MVHIGAIKRLSNRWTCFDEEIVQLARVERDEQDSSDDEPEEVGSSHSDSHGETKRDVH